MSLYTLKKRGRRGVGAGFLAFVAMGAVAMLSFGAAYGSVETESDLPDQDLHGGLYNEIVWLDNSGRIEKDISPNEPVEDFELHAQSISNLPGHVLLYPKKIDLANFSDGFLDNTLITVTIRLHNNFENVGTVTLREWLTNGYMSADVDKNGNAVVQPNEQLHWTVRVTPATTAEGFTNDDLRQVGQVFDMTARFSAIEADGQSKLSRYAIAQGGRVSNSLGQDAFYSVPISTLDAIISGGVNS